MYKCCLAYSLSFNCRLLNIGIRSKRYYIMAGLNCPCMVASIAVIPIRVLYASLQRICPIYLNFSTVAITIDRICFIFICQFCHPVICIAAITVICFGQVCNQNCKRREAVGRESQVTIAGNIHFQLFQISALMEDFYVCRRGEVQTGNGNFAGLLKLKAALIFGADIECIKGIILFRVNFLDKLVFQILLSICIQRLNIQRCCTLSLKLMVWPLSVTLLVASGFFHFA